MIKNATQSITMRPAAPLATPAAETPKISHDTIFVSLENWDEMWRRNQFVVSELARLAPAQKFLFVGLCTDITQWLRQGVYSKIGQSLFFAETPDSPVGLPNVYLLNVVKWLPNTLAFGRKFNQWIERKQIQRTARRIGITKPLLWLNPEAAVHMVGKMDEQGVVYDITDDWSSAAQSEWTRQRILAEDAELCRRADLTVVCSERLFEMKRDLAHDLVLIPNGVEAERYRLVGYRDSGEALFTEAEKTLPLPEEAKNWPHPVVGYTGTVHPERMDLQLVAELARQFPEATFPLIGQIHLEPEESKLFEGLPNIKMVGPVPYRDLQAWMRSFDVCMVPHVVTPFTESLNPLKLFEYLAAGLPIVSTDVAGFRDYGPETAHPLVYIARGEAEEARNQAFFAAVREAVAERADHSQFAVMRDLRQQEARLHTWQARADQLIKKMKKAIPAL